MLEVHKRTARTLKQALDHATGHACPPRLAQALRYAVFPGGARLRPEICITVAEACGGANPELADAAAAAVELLHCASLIYDDLPCFDDAPLRRGRSTVHVVFGEPLAVLAGNALTVLAFEWAARASSPALESSQLLLRLLARGAGSAGGITAGQAWESEPHVVDVGAYHRAKTGALFEAAFLMGAAAGGDDPDGWVGVGDDLGEAYQIVDDLVDACACVEVVGKSVGRDAAHRRPSAVAVFGVDGCVRRVDLLVEQATTRVPPCPGRSGVLDLLRRQGRHMRARCHDLEASSRGAVASIQSVYEPPRESPPIDEIEV